MDIENTTLAHFRHFSPLFTNLPSTPVKNVRQIRLFMQNKPNFPHFSPENDDFTKKQTQFKPNTKPIQTQSKPILGQYQGWQSQTKPILSWNLSRACPRSVLNCFPAGEVLLTRLAAGECEHPMTNISDITCLWRLQFNADFSIIIELLTSYLLRFQEKRA